MKIDSPMTITKETAPYLYLTDDSGLYFNRYGSGSQMGIPMNPGLKTDYWATGLQMWIRPRGVPVTNGDIMWINGINIFGDVDTDPGRILIDFPARIFLNGYETQHAYLMPDEWNALTLIFESPMNLASIDGWIVIESGFLVNNVAVFTHQQADAPRDPYWGEPEPKNHHGDLVGTSKVVVNDLSSISVFPNGTDIFTDVRWQQVEKNII